MVGRRHGRGRRLAASVVGVQGHDVVVVQVGREAAAFPGLAFWLMLAEPRSSRSRRVSLFANVTEVRSRPDEPLALAASSWRPGYFAGLSLLAKVLRLILQASLDEM